MTATPIYAKRWLDQPARRADLCALLLVLVFLTSGVAALPKYGLTWDESLGNLFFGERYLNYFATFNEKYLDFDEELRLHSQHPLNLYLSPFRTTPNEFPPLADTLSAGTMYLFSYTLGWLNPVDGFHLFTVLLCATFLWTLYRFLASRFGRFIALMALVFLGSFPRVWGDMHFNVKDVPEMLFFGATVLAYWRWREHPRWREALLAGVLFGCALAVKANAIFILPLLLAAQVPWRLDKAAWLDAGRHFWQTAWQYALMAAGALAVYMLSWPYLYAAPLQRLKAYWTYIFSQGGRSGGTAWNIDPLRQAVTTMPEAMLLFLLIGLVVVVVSVIRTNSLGGRVLLFWLLVPLARSSLPGMVNFDGIRHFMEFVPAAVAIAAIGLVYCTDWIARRIQVRQALPRGAAVLLVLVNVFLIYQGYFPNLHLYYNAAVGGLSGARDAFLGEEATDYWGVTYRQGIDWINANAPAGSYVQAVIAGWIVEISGPILLRPDLRIISVGQLEDYKVLRQKPVPTYLMFITRGVADNSTASYITSHETPVQQVLVDGVVVMEVYRFGGTALSAP